MKFTIQKTKQGLEKNIISSSVLNTEFLKMFKHVYRPGCMSTPYGDWLSGVCIEYLAKYGTAPGKDVLDIFKSSLKAGRVNPTMADVTLDFLKSLDFKDPPTINHGYLAKKAQDYFVLQLHRQLLRRLELAVEKGDAQLCEEAVAEVKKVRLQTGQVCDPFADKDKVREAFLKDEKPLFKLSGAIGKMLNPQLKSKRMLAFIATAKRGKTWLEYKLAKTAKRYGNHVAVFAAGDEDEDSSIIRFGTMLTGKNTDDEYTGTFAFPLFDCVKNQTDNCFKRCRKGRGRLPDIPKEEFDRMTPEQILDKCPKWRPCAACRNTTKYGVYEAAVWYKNKTVGKLVWQDAWKAFTRFRKFSPKSSLRLFTYSAQTLTVSEIIRQLDMAEDMDDWVPTVVVVDYPDIMQDESDSKEVRHKENEKWLKLRKLSQDRSILLILVTQSNTGGYGSDSIVATNVNEDRRKLDHVTGLFAINQSDDEKRKRIARIGSVVQRKGRADIEFQVMILQELEKGNMFTDSQYVYRSVKPKNDKK